MMTNMISTNMISTLKVTAYVADIYCVQNNLKKLAVEIVDGYLVPTAFFNRLQRKNNKMEVVGGLRWRMMEEL